MKKEWRRMKSRRCPSARCAQAAWDRTRKGTRAFALVTTCSVLESNVGAQLLQPVLLIWACHRLLQRGIVPCFRQMTRPGTIELLVAGCLPAQLDVQDSWT
eukprot:1157352-Pelagomonas_calceolata.AAC.11